MYTKKYKKDISNIESSIEEELKEKLLSLSNEDFKQYFEAIIDKYYNVLFTFEADYSKYYEESKKKYKLIENVKSIVKTEFNNLDNYENYVRLKKAEEIAYNQMITLYFMESSVYASISKIIGFIGFASSKLL